MALSRAGVVRLAIALLIMIENAVTTGWALAVVAAPVEASNVVFPVAHLTGVDKTIAAHVAAAVPKRTRCGLGRASVNEGIASWAAERVRGAR